jgi:hypothetical protein
LRGTSAVRGVRAVNGGCLQSTQPAPEPRPNRPFSWGQPADHVHFGVMSEVAQQFGPGVTHVLVTYGLFAHWLSQSPTPTKLNKSVWVLPRPASPPTQARSLSDPPTPPPPSAPPPRAVYARPFHGAYPGSSLIHRLAQSPLRDEDSSRLLMLRSVLIPRVELSFV